MTGYTIRRIIQMFPVLFVVLCVTFLLMRFSPGDPAAKLLGIESEATPEQYAAVRKRLGLDDPMIYQFGKWLGDILRGDLGRSYFSKNKVTTLIWQRLPKSVELALVALAIALPIAMVAGVLSAVYRGTWIDHLSTGFVTAGIAIPGFWLAIMLVMFFSVRLDWLPSSGYVPFATDPIGHIKILIMPAATLSILVAAPAMRFLRSSMLEVLRQDYIRTARAKGLVQRVVIMRHALKNAMIPTVTFVGLQFANLLAGTILIEFIFGWTGLGWITVASIHAQDYLVVQGMVLVFAFFFVVVNLAVDLLYAVLDPRIRYS